MDSEVDSSLFNRSATQETQDTEDSVKNSCTRGRSAVATWIHSRPGQAENNEDPTEKYCIHCPAGSKIYYSTIATNFRRHLKVHKIFVNPTPSTIQTTVAHQLEQLYLQAESSSNEASNLEKAVFQKYLNQDVIDEALVSLIVVRNLPFRTVEWPEFHTFCQVLNPESATSITSTHSEIGKKIHYSWCSNKDIIRRKVQSAISSVHIALDVWTSPNQLLLLGIVAHITDHQEQYKKALLALRPIANHSGAEQFAVLLPVLKDYSIVRKLGAVVGDNATPNDTLCREIQEYMAEEEGIKWDVSRWRLRCTGHIINLAVQAFLFQNALEIEELELYNEQEGQGEIRDKEEKRIKFRLLGPLGQLHNIIVHIRGSTARIQEFTQLAKRLVPLDNRTRWNSWYLMLIVALELQSAIDSYTKSHLETLEADYLTP